MPPSQLERLARELGGPTRLQLFDSRYGHDAFLKDLDVLATLVGDALAEEIR